AARRGPAAHRQSRPRSRPAAPASQARPNPPPLIAPLALPAPGTCHKSGRHAPSCRAENDMADEHVFDLDNPKLPKWVKKRALTSGGYPYDRKMGTGDYEEELDALYLELAKLQDDQAKTGRRIVMVFEGRDAAGKGGTIRRYLKNLNPR